MGEGHLRERGRRGVTTTHMPNGDLLTGSGFVIPAQAHATYLAHQRRRRRQAVRRALSEGKTVPFSEEQLREDGWPERTIRKVTGGEKG